MYIIKLKRCTFSACFVKHSLVSEHNNKISWFNQSWHYTLHGESELACFPFLFQIFVVDINMQPKQPSSAPSVRNSTSSELAVAAGENNKALNAPCRRRNAFSLSELILIVCFLFLLLCVSVCARLCVCVCKSLAVCELCDTAGCSLCLLAGYQAPRDPQKQALPVNAPLKRASAL